MIHLKNLRCASCEYSIEIRNGDTATTGLTPRTYIWLGGQYPSGHAKSGQDWCFAYGEKEWIDGKEFESIRDQTKRVINVVSKPTDISSEESCI